MGRYKKSLSFLTVAVMILGLSIVASAQWRNSRGNNSYYGNRINHTNLHNAIGNLNRKSRDFRKMLDRELDRSSYDGSRTEKNLNDLAKRFRNAADDLDDEYDNPRDFNKSRNEAQRVISYGSQLDNALSRARINRNSYLRNSWRSIERDLRVVARAFNSNYNRNDRYNRNEFLR